MADTATYVGSDVASQGTWKGVRGSLGFNVIADAIDYPSNVAVTVTGNSPFTWESSTSDVRAPQKSSSVDPNERIAACWFGASISINLNFADASIHRVALYLLDWDRRSRTCRVDVLNSLGVVLDTRNVNDYDDGVCLIWDVSGNITIRIVNTGTHPDATIAGIFFDGAGTPPDPGLTQENAYVGVQVDNTQSISAEHVIWSEESPNIQQISTEHAIVNSWPPNTQRFSQMFVVVARHDAPPPTMAQLTVNKTVVPPNDDGKFNLLIDGIVEGIEIGGGGTTGAVEVTPGLHTVSEGAGTGTDLDDYDTVIGGDAASDGSITLVAGESKTVSITNTRKAAPPLPPQPPQPASGCPPPFTLRRVAVTLRRATHLPVRGADS